jgi:hypothetical protein
MGVGHTLQWQDIRAFLPLELDEIAVETGALARRRGVAGGEALTRLLLLMALPGATLEQAARTAREAGIADLGKTAMFKRLSGSERFLKSLFERSLGFACERAERFAGLDLVAVDATVLCGPGSKGTDQVLHVVYDLGKRAPRSVELTGPGQGETLAIHSSFGPGDLLLGDRGYGHTRGLSAALRLKANLLVRVEPARTLRLYDASGTPLKLESFMAALGDEGRCDLQVRLEPEGADLRALGCRNREGKAVWLLTNLSRDVLPEAQARALYSKRWQVELFFKRLKSLAGIGRLPSRDGPTARAWIWAKLVVASLSVLASDERFSPWGWPPERLEAVCGRALEDGPGPAHGALRQDGQEGKAPEEEAGQGQATQAAHPLEA